MYQHRQNYHRIYLSCVCVCELFKIQIPFSVNNSSLQTRSPLIIITQTRSIVQDVILSGIRLILSRDRMMRGPTPRFKRLNALSVQKRGVWARKRVFTCKYRRKGYMATISEAHNFAIVGLSGYTE